MEGKMLVRLEPCEWLLIGRGVFALFACIVAGSIIVEIQLNQLTYWLDFVQVFNLRPVAEGAYLAYVLGTEYYIQAAWQVGTIAMNGRSLDVTLLGFAVDLPTQVSVDASLVLTFVKTAWQQGIEYAFACKRYLSDCWADYAPFLRSLYQQAADLVR
jgi:hypothetical protein